MLRVSGPVRPGCLSALLVPDRPRGETLATDLLPVACPPRTDPGRVLHCCAWIKEGGHRRVTGLLRRAGWRVNHKRVERIRRQEGLRVPHRQPKRGRLWLNDGSCVRLAGQAGRADALHRAWKPMGERVH